VHNTQLRLESGRRPEKLVELAGVYVTLKNGLGALATVTFQDVTWVVVASQVKLPVRVAPDGLKVKF
jgi:hypothetical protein